MIQESCGTRGATLSPVLPLFLVCCLVAAALAPFANADETLPPNGVNPKAVQEVKAGTLKTANASWWGFKKADSTEALQAAIDSGAAKLIVPYMGEPWIVRPIKLRGHLDITFEPGVIVLAKRGEFKGKGDSLFTAVDATNLAIHGYGAIFRMWKQDYESSAYQRAEWRMGLALRGCVKTRVEGLRIEKTGGDGIYIDGGGSRKWSQDVTIRDVTCYDNHRQGISVISAQDLLIENCVLADTCGTAPESGIDLEPDSADQRLVNCVIRNCVFENNQGHEIAVYLKQLTAKSKPVSITFENCLCRMGKPGMTRADFKDPNMRGWAGMAVGACADNGPKGLIEFRNCVTENTGKEGAKVYDKSADGVKVRFVNCSWKTPWVSWFPDYAGPRVPILLDLRRPQLTNKPGGVEFVNCYVYDDVDRPVVLSKEDKSAFGVRDIKGSIIAHVPGVARVKLGPNAKDNSLTVTKATD